MGSISRHWSARERSSSSNTCGRRGGDLGAGDIPVARRTPSGSSDCHRGVLRRGATLVRALRAAQFRTLPDAAIPAPAAILVLRADYNSRAAAVVGVLDRRSTRSVEALAGEI